MYINTHTYYSLRYGTIKPKDLLEMAQKNKVKCMALTDINNTSACMDFVRLSKNYDIKPVLGVDFRNSALQQFEMLARSNEGFQHINDYLSSLLHQDEFVIPDRAPQLEETFVIYNSIRLYKWMGWYICASIRVKNFKNK